MNTPKTEKQIRVVKKDGKSSYRVVEVDEEGDPLNISRQEVVPSNEEIKEAKSLPVININACNASLFGVVEME